MATQSQPAAPFNPINGVGTSCLSLLSPSPTLCFHYASSTFSVTAGIFPNHSSFPTNEVHSNPIAVVRMLVALTCLTLTLSFQATSHNPTIFHHIDIDHVGTQSSSASCAMLMRPNKTDFVIFKPHPITLPFSITLILIMWEPRAHLLAVPC